MKPRCIRCNRTPGEIEEYREAAEDAEMTPDLYVRTEEGTYNSDNGHFVCTDCYVTIGMPTSLLGWKAP